MYLFDFECVEPGASKDSYESYDCVHFRFAIRETNSVHVEAPASISLTGINVYYFTDRMHAHFILNNKTCFKFEHELMILSFLKYIL